MAISSEAGILAMLKTYYAKEGLQNLLYRNDPLLKTIKTQRVEGKQANFSALFSRGGAVSANFLTAKALATSQAQAKEFQVTPGQMFSCCVFNNKELLASKSLRGAYINVASAKFFANAESFRKTMAVALYGTGHGELFTTSASITLTADDQNDITFPQYAIMGIDIGSRLEVKATAAATSVTATLTVNKINGTTVNCTSDTAATAASGSVVCIAGCTDSNGNGLLPVGLAGWIPSGSVSSSDSFYGVNRSTARDRLAGTVTTATSGEAKYKTIERAILALRRMGSLCDKIVMNDEDYLALSQEIDQKTYFTKVDGGKGQSKSELGRKDFGFSVSTNWLENVIDSPYCPKGTCYILSSDTVELWTYTNADKIADGVPGNEAGKPEVNGETDVQNKPYQLLVDDMFTITPGTDTADGAAALVALNFYGTFVITNPSVNGVVTLN
jgi:hypothetical protein